MPRGHDVAVVEPGTNARVPAVALLGHHNVGKSVLFHRLTGRFASVANYPGTTVEVAQGTSRALDGCPVLDTPGILGFPARSEDEQATARMLLSEPLQTIVQVGDAKNLRRTLLLTVQLAELGLPMVLALNMMDEADARGVRVETDRLHQWLGLPVLHTIAVTGAGVEALVGAVREAGPPRLHLTYGTELECALAEIGPHLPPSPIAPRAVALLWLSGDRVIESWAAERLDDETYRRLVARREALQLSFPQPISEIIQRARLMWVAAVAAAVITAEGRAWIGLGATLGRLAAHPLWGLPILAAVLAGVYWFVGILGAGTLVGILEERLFSEIINPRITTWVSRVIPTRVAADFLVGEYGLWTMGMTYALALILPIVTTFFAAFGVLEDSGYLPRLSVLSNRIFRALGLNGKAALPMVLGLGCVTMATLTTRILESRRDRFLVILLLALAVPCSAQLGVVMGMLASISPAATMIWGGVVGLVLLVVGWLAARLVPGERSLLVLELPPLRRPSLAAVVTKTAARLEWYLKEVVPLFLAGSALVFVLDRAGVLPALIRAARPLVTGWLGLPPQASAAFLMGFLRRDFGATGLFTLESQGLLTPLQAVVAMVTITLFIPCVASVLIIARERGPRTAAAVTALVFPLAFAVGGALYRILGAFGWGS
jgi:ferrous iron transport protein B